MRVIQEPQQGAARVWLQAEERLNLWVRMTGKKNLPGRTMDLNCGLNREEQKPLQTLLPWCYSAGQVLHNSIMKPSMNKETRLDLCHIPSVRSFWPVIKQRL